MDILKNDGEINLKKTDLSNSFIDHQLRGLFDVAFEEFTIPNIARMTDLERVAAVLIVRGKANYDEVVDWYKKCSAQKPVSHGLNDPESFANRLFNLVLIKSNSKNIEKVSRDVFAEMQALLTTDLENNEEK